MGLHPTASSSEMQPEEIEVSKSSDELQSTNLCISYIVCISYMYLIYRSLLLKSFLIFFLPVLRILFCSVVLSYRYTSETTGQSF